VRRLCIALIGLTTIGLALILGAALYVHAQSTESSVCGDPTAPCWTQGKPVYEGFWHIWGFGILPNWVIPGNAGLQFLNTGPNIPHLVVATNTQGGRVLSAPVATLRTTSGSHLLAPRRLHSAAGIRAWDLGTVPDGSVVWFQVRVRKTKRYPAQAWENLYGNVTSSGGVDWSAPVLTGPPP
jgi:hypothetical protein